MVEVLLTCSGWRDERRMCESALVKPAKKVQVGEVADVFGEGLRAEVMAAGEFGERTLRFEAVEDFYGALERVGHLPLPPYIRRGKDVSRIRAEDRERYQTVYSKPLGSAEESAVLGCAYGGAALYAGGACEELKARGVEVVTADVACGAWGRFSRCGWSGPRRFGCMRRAYTISAKRRRRR